MDYKKQVNPELRGIAKRIPYNKAVIRCANVYQSIALRLTKIPKGVSGKRITVKGYNGIGFKVDVFEPSDRKGKLPCLIYAHGGAFSYKASAYHKKLACIYAVKARCRVFFPDYHLLPEYPYPAAYEDMLALYRWIMRNAKKCKIDIDKIGAAGDSAGAMLAASVCNHYEREGLIKPCVQMLIYPVADANIETNSMKMFSDAPLWNLKSHKRWILYYYGNMKREKIYETTPMHGRLPETIPAAYIETAEYDCLHDEGILYGERLRKAGAHVEINETKGTVHGYDSAIGTQIAITNIKKRIAFLRDAFYGDSF